MSRHKTNRQASGFNKEACKPLTIDDPWAEEYPWSGGLGDTFLHRIRSLSYGQRRAVLARQSYPRYLYKFKALHDKNTAHLEDIVLRSRLYLSSPRSFNDPFDMSSEIVARGTTDDALLKINSSLAVPVEDKARMCVEVADFIEAKGMKAFLERHQLPLLFRKMLNTSGVFSFTSSKKSERESAPRSILMWSYYADSHRGLCFQFEIARDPLLMRGLLRVEYVAKFPEVNWLSSDFAEQIVGALCHKSPCWKHEHEWRLILPEKENTYLPFSPHALTGVILGCEITARKEKLIRSMIDKRIDRGLPSLQIMRAVRSQSEYKIMISK